MNAWVEIEPRTFVGVETEEPVFYAAPNYRGEPTLWRRGIYLPHDVAERLLPLLEADRDLADLAQQLRQAMETVDALV